MSVSTSVKSKYAGKLLSLFLIIQAVNNLFSGIIKNQQTVDFLKIVLGVLFVLYLVPFILNYRQTALKLFFAEGLFVALLIISLALNTHIVSQILSRCIWTFLFCIPLAVITSEIEDMDAFFHVFRIPTYVMLGISVIVFFNILSEYDASRMEYNMSLGYMLLFPVLYHINTIRQHKFHVLLASVEVLMITTLGSRGPLLCIALYVLIRLFFSKEKRALKWLPTKILLILFAVFINPILHALLSVLERFGIESRTIILMLSGNITSDSGRGEIWATTWQHILEKPLFGWGIAGDLNFFASYPHQIFLEIMIHFGLIIGGIISVYIVYKLIRGLYISRSSDSFNGIVLLFLCAGFVPLLLSNTYLQVPLAWVALAICSNTKNNFFTAYY